MLDDLQRLEQIQRLRELVIVLGGEFERRAGRVLVALVLLTAARLAVRLGFRPGLGIRVFVVVQVTIEIGFAEEGAA
jgi:hypothetical protein